MDGMTIYTMKIEIAKLSILLPPFISVREHDLSLPFVFDFSCYSSSTS